MGRTQPVLGIDPDDTILANAALIVPVRIAELLAYERYIGDPARVVELHQMRIGAKRLRYTMEMFAPFCDAWFVKAIERIKSIQEQIGQIHDADVLVPELAAHLMGVLPKGKRDRARGAQSGDFEAAAGLLSLCRSKRKERDDLYVAFLLYWRKLRSTQFFETLRTNIRNAAYQQRAAAAVFVDPAAATLPVTAKGSDDEEHHDEIGTEPAASRLHRRSGVRSGPGNHTNAVVAQGGVEQHQLFEEGDDL